MLVTLTYRPEFADVGASQRGYAAIRDLLTVDGREPLAFIQKGERGGVWLRVLCGSPVSFRHVRDGWSSVARGSVSFLRVRNAAVLGLLAGCESLAGQTSSS